MGEADGILRVVHSFLGQRVESSWERGSRLHSKEIRGLTGQWFETSQMRGFTGQRLEVLLGS